jgi:hypothetical protein
MRVTNLECLTREESSTFILLYSKFYGLDRAVWRLIYGFYVRQAA